MSKEPIVFPKDFKQNGHPHIPGATQWLYEKPGRIPELDHENAISIVGGGMGLYGDGVTTFEMYDFREGEPQGYLSIEEINKHLASNPF